VPHTHDTYMESWCSGNALNTVREVRVRISVDYRDFSYCVFPQSVQTNAEMMP
jgi:hypothetical protein